MSTNSSPSPSSSLILDQPTKTSSPLKFIYFFCGVYGEYYPPGFLRKVLAELIATFLLVFVTCGAAALSNSDEGRISKLGASIAGGLIVTVMIYAVGHVSGAHMNPAVTCAFAAVRRFPWKQVPFYAAAQLTGAVVASFTLLILLQPIKNIGTTSPSGTDFQALVMEIVVTFSMMFVTAVVATDTKAVGELAGLAVGSAVCITSILAGYIYIYIYIYKHYKGIWVYIIGPLFGTNNKAWSYNLIRGLEEPTAPSTSSSSIRIRRSQRNYDEQPDVPNKDPLEII
ncbi:hypothetical protein MKX03_010032 [Papaver bracteatum]|nr:hypothetical protein MKX03_010032 [Papaver bracteatum]